MSYMPDPHPESLIAFIGLVVSMGTAVWLRARRRTPADNRNQAREKEKRERMRSRREQNNCNARPRR